MTLDEFEFKPVLIDNDKLSKAKSENEFMYLSVELFKELAQYIAILSCLYKSDEDGNARLWTRDEAVFGGLMVRTAKLMHGFLDNICKNRMELAMIFSRCLGETAINLKYLIVFKSPDLINEFIAYSLRTEKKLLEEIEENIAVRGEEIPIEMRMKRSIYKSFELSSVTPEQIDSSERSVWGGSIYKRFQKLGMESVYLALFQLQSHSLHGNWEEIIRYHLIYEDDAFAPNVEWESPRPQPVLALCTILTDTSLFYLDDFVQDCKEKEFLKGLLNNFELRVKELGDLHEKYLVKRSQI